MKKHDYYVYVMTNDSNRVLYTGVTSDLRERVNQHKQKTFQGFTLRYHCNKLVYFEEFQWIQDAIAREKQLKGGSRLTKRQLVMNENPNWDDLSSNWYD